MASQNEDTFDAQINANQLLPKFRLNPRAKRTFDVVAASVGLVVFAPILLFVSLTIAAKSPGPILIRETRYGYKGPIRVFKFRLDGAGRRQDTTWVGRILHSSRIDELPRLLNVLRGEMSIVGPRPYRSVQDHSLSILHDVKPGLTGLAQMSDRRGEFESAHQRIRDDLCYVENWTLFLDVKIMLAALFSGN